VSKKQSASGNFPAKTKEEKNLVLASGSPRRKELLAGLGLDFKIVPSTVDETSEIKDPVQLVRHLSYEKAKDVAERIGTHGSFVIGADTIVVLGRKILGKPSSHDDAYEMLMQLSGRTHSVFTGVTLVEIYPSTLKSESIYRESKVHFRRLHASEARYYADSDEPMDKAGAYALQGVAAAFIDHIEGCYSNIIGLPVSDTALLLRKHGITVMGLGKELKTDG